METSLDFFFEKASKWQNDYKKLREIALSTSLTEELKWGKPCYTYDGANVFLIHELKEYCAVFSFNPDENQMTLKQRGANIVMTKARP